MPNIGERLEEARKRQGVSIREAAEATKIRADFLLEYENNRFDFDLPEVYKRGFLKLYARYLKLDPDKMATDYNAHLLGAGKLGKREKGEFFGRMDLPEPAQPTPTTAIGSSESQPPFGEHHAEAHGRRAAPRPQPADAVEHETDASLYWKIALVFVGVFLLIGLFVLLIQSLMRGGADTDTTADEPIPAVADASTPAVAPAAPGSVRLVAKGDLLRVMVRAEPDGEELLRQPMSAGDVVEFERDGVIRVFSTDIDQLEVEIDGRRYSSPSSGVGQMWFDRDGPVNRPR